MILSIKKYIHLRDWRLIVIEVVSFVLAVLSAFLLEAKFFKLFIKEDIGATALAIFIVFGVTFTAHAVADNLQSKTERDGWYHATIFFLIVSYVGVLISLLGMSNYTMAVSKFEKDSIRLNAGLTKVDSLPKIIKARRDMDAAIAFHTAKIAGLEADVKKLRDKENSENIVYATQKRGFESLIAQNNSAIKIEHNDFNVLREKEESRLKSESVVRAAAGKNESSIGLFLSENPAVLPVLVLVILFVGRLTFEPQSRPAVGVHVTRTESTTTTHEHKFTFETIPGDWKKAIELVAEERRLGNGTGLGAMVAKKFNKSEAWVSTSVKRLIEKSGEPN